MTAKLPITIVLDHRTALEAIAMRARDMLDVIGPCHVQVDLQLIGEQRIEATVTVSEQEPEE